MVWIVKKINGYVSNGQDDMVSVGLVIGGILAVAALLCVIMLIYMIRTMLKGKEGHIKDSAKNSKLPVSEIEQFERQAVGNDCYRRF